MYIYSLVSYSLRELGASLVSNLQLDPTRSIETRLVYLVVNPLALPNLSPYGTSPPLDPFRVWVGQVRHIEPTDSPYISFHFETNL
jgi:hypothetical protein